MTIYGDPRPYTDEDTYHQALKSEDADELEQLAKIPYLKTRKAVAGNIYTDVETLTLLARENAEPVRTLALINIGRQKFPGYDTEEVARLVGA